MKRIVKSKNGLRGVRHTRIRVNLKGTSTLPRLSVFRSIKSMTAQLVDDENGKTLVYVNGKDVKAKKVEDKTAKVSVAFAVGEKIAELAKAKGIEQVIFDRAGYQYHGRVEAVADGARKGGLKF